MRGVSKVLGLGLILIAGPALAQPAKLDAYKAEASRGVDEIGSVIVDGRKIVAAGKAALSQGVPEGATVVDCAGKTIIPGLVDARVFIGEPGGEHRETIASASVAAAGSSPGE